MQSSLGAAWTTAKQRLLGTLVGVVFGACWVTAFGGSPAVLYCSGLALLGGLAAVMRMELIGYRFAGITFTIICLSADPRQIWWIGLYRFVEVSLGIATSLVVTAAATRIHKGKGC